MVTGMKGRITRFHDLARSAASNDIARPDPEKKLIAVTDDQAQGSIDS